MYPHCKHCIWGDEFHPDDAPGHDSPCFGGTCPGNHPAPDQPTLFEPDTTTREEQPA